MVDKKTQHIEMIKHLQGDLQEHVTKTNYLLEELKKVNQQLLEVDKQTFLLQAELKTTQANYETVILKNIEEKKKVSGLTTKLESLRNDLAQYQASEE